MLRMTLRSLWEHKRRLISTSLAILLGVAFMSGTLVLSDTLDKVFDDLFADFNEGVDAQVQGVELFDSQFGTSFRARIDPALLDEVRALPDVAEAEPYVATLAVTLLDEKGDPIGGTGPPTIVEAWVGDSPLNALTISAGRAPEAEGEVVINRTAVEDAGFELGDEVTLVTQGGRQPFELVGIATFGDQGSAGGTTLVEVTLTEAQRLAGAGETLDTILVAAKEGVSQEAVVASIAPLLSPQAEVITGQQAADDLADSTSQGFAFFSQLLLVFAGIALFVGSFIIYNTFSILVAQRTREMALLRAIGASRRQVMSSVLIEAVTVGLVSAVLGLIVGVLLAIGVQAALAAIGLELPNAGTVVRPSTVFTALVVGLVITVLAAISPAIRATRVPPIAALRDVAIDRSGGSKLRAALGLLLVILGVASMAPAFGDDPESSVLAGVGLGALLLLIGVIVLGPVIAKPLASLIGVGLPKLKGVTGQVARQNAVRSPRRTASTAAALMIGVALIAFITVFAASAKASITSEVDRGFRGDFVVSSANQFSFTGAPVELTTKLGEVPGVAVATGQGFAEASLTMPDGDSTSTFIGAIDPLGFTQVFEPRMDVGALADLSEGGIVVDRQVARDRSLKIGDTIKLTLPGGKTGDLRVDAISDDPSLLGQWTITRADYGELASERFDNQIGIKLDDGTSVADIRPALEKVIDEYPPMRLQDRDEFVGSIVNQITALLNVIYGLLALSVIIALIGIGNTLSLSIHERTRELGLMRAVGMTRSQLRSSVRWEAVIVALLGTGLGLVLGLALSYTMVKALSSQGLTTFQLPFGSVVTVVVFGAVIGVLASLRPAWKASKLNILEAVGSE